MPEILFTLGRYSVVRVPGTSRLYRSWYDAGAGEVRRRSLKTPDLEAAKIALAAIVLTEGDGRAREPKDVTLMAVLTRYWEEHSDTRRNPSAARRAGNLWLDFLADDTAKVSALTKAKQREFIRWCREKHGHSVAYISRVQSIVAAALNRAVAEEDDEDGALLTRAPRIIVHLSRVAEILEAPEPTPRNWHPDMTALARFIDAIPEDEHTRLLRFTLLLPAFGSRPEAIKELAPFQIDRQHRLVHLNPPGRRQTKKHRPTLPVPDVLWPTLLTWCEAERIVHNRGRAVVVLRKPWDAVRTAAGLPRQFTPYALRHMIGTELRKRGVALEQREMWMGHRRDRSSDRYGQFGPEYLATAKAAVDAFLTELGAACETPLFRQVSAKPISKVELAYPTKGA